MSGSVPAKHYFLAMVCIFWSSMAIFPDATTVGAANTIPGPTIGPLWAGSSRPTIRGIDPVFALAADPAPPDLGSIQLFDADFVNFPDLEWTNGTTVIVHLNAVGLSPEWVEIDEDPGFGSPTIYSFVGPSYPYTFDNAANETKTVYARLGNSDGPGLAASDTIGLDTVPPEQPAPPTDAGDISYVVAATFSWTATSDPAPGSGVSTYDCRIGTSPGGADLFNANVGPATTIIHPGPYGETLFCRVRAIDRAGNSSGWSESSNGIYIESVPVSVTLVDADGANNHSAGWTNASPVIVRLVAVPYFPQYVEMDEDPGFSSPLRAAFNNTDYLYPFDSLNNGAKTVYVRFANDYGAGRVISATTNLDTSPPERPAAPTDEGEYSLSRTVLFRWTPAGDPGPVGGVLLYHFGAGTSPGSSDLLFNNVGLTSQKSVVGPYGQMVYGRVRALDHAGNPSQWSESSDGIFIDSEAWHPSLVDADGANGPDPGWTNASPAIVRIAELPYVPQYIEMDEDPAFSSPAHAQFVGTDYPYVFHNLTNEIKTVYVRMVTDAGSGRVVACAISLDTVAPEPPAAPTDAGDFSLTPAVVFNWSTTTDPDPASGIYFYTCRIGSSPGGSDLFLSNLGLSLSKSFTGPTGKTLYCGVQACDLAGNAGSWSPSSDGIFIDSAPGTPSVTIRPSAPRTLDNITASALAVDPDAGDSVVAYTVDWLLNGDIEASGPVLSAALTAKGQTWQCRVRAQDRYGLWGSVGTRSFSIVNTPPSQPVLQILPRTPGVNEDLVVDITGYSLDPDGDPVSYDLNWYKSLDHGHSWIHKSELTGVPNVLHQYLSEGEVWRVTCMPYEDTGGAGNADGIETILDGTPLAVRIEGSPAVDQVYVGTNHLPSLTFMEGPRAAAVNGGYNLSVRWIYGDPDAEPCTVSLNWTEEGSLATGYLAAALNAQLRAFDGFSAMSEARPLYLQAIIQDAKGAVTHVTSPPIVFENAGIDFEVSHISASGYQTGFLHPGETVYADRAYQFTEPIPFLLGGRMYIRTRNADKNSVGADFLRFDINKPATIYVALDDRIVPPPAWMHGWRTDGDALQTSDPNPGRRVYRKNFQAGTVVLGGNLDIESSIPGLSMYTVLIVPEEAISTGASEWWMLY